MIDFFNNILNYLTTIKDFFALIFEFFKTLASFIPTPFNQITLVFIVILGIIFIYRIVRS